jgi:hypothetical protein
VTCQGGFHVYAVEWDRSTNPEQMRFYLDGVNFHTVHANQMDAGTWAAATNHGFFIILNVAMGGEFPAALGGGPDGATSPGHPMLVDYVTVMSSNGGTTPPTSSTPPPTCGPLISQGRPVVASGVESANQAAAFAVDGNPNTRWSSAFTEPQWIQVDLGSVQAISRVRLNWEVAFGRAYSIQLSTNGSTWTDAYTTANGNGGIEDLAVSGNARYVRMYGIQRATVYGFSLWEMEVYGGCGTPPSSTTSSSTTTQPGTYPAWAPNTAYAVGARVTYSSVNYQCLQAHTSIVSWEPPNTPALWQRL